MKYTHRDLAGNLLEEGVEVAVLGKRYRELVIGKIVRCTEKMVRVSYPKTGGVSGNTESSLSPNQMMRIVKITNIVDHQNSTEDKYSVKNSTGDGAYYHCHSCGIELIDEEVSAVGFIRSTSEDDLGTCPECKCENIVDYGE